MSNHHYACPALRQGHFGAWEKTWAGGLVQLGLGKAVTPLWCFLTLLCVFSFPGRFVGDTHTVLSEVKLSPFAGLRQERDEYMLMIEMMVNKTLSSKLPTVLFPVFACYSCVTMEHARMSEDTGCLDFLVFRTRPRSTSLLLSGVSKCEYHTM